MSVPPNQRQVSLRGSSAKEITRDALLEKVSHERELRSYLRRASTASLFIQRVWRRYYNMKKASVQLREEWDALSDRHSNSIAKNYVSEELLKPFLFFITQSPWSNQNQDPNLVNCASFCFNILLTSINSLDPDKNFCSLAIGTKQERSTWLYQSKKLVSLCSSILSQCNFSNSRVDSEKTTQLSLLSMRLSISLTDTKTWKFLNNDTSTNANTALKKLIAFMATRKSGLYNSIRKYIINLNSTRIVEKQIAPNEDGFLISASAITLALRPLNSKNMEIELKGFEIEEAYIEFIVFILTIPFLFKNLPPLLLPAMRHGSVLKPCLATLLISERKIFEEISKLEALNAEKLPHYGWILPNIINLATNYDHNSSGGIIEGLDCSQYIRSVNCVSRNFLNLLETNVNNKEINLDNNESNNGSNIESSFIGLLAPVHQQWHLTKLLSLSKDDNTLELNDIMYFYYYMLRIFSILNPVIGSMPILNVLSFNPEFIVKLWVSLEKSIFVGANNCVITEIKPSSDTNSQTKQNKGIKDTRWVNVLQIIKGKSLDNDETGAAGTSNSESYINGDISNDDKLEIWDIEFLRKEYKNFPNQLLYTLHLFCTSYGHLLLVLDDIEFYEKQVPFKLESQRKIASVLNTFVYNSFIRGNNSNNNNNNNNNNKDLIEVATRCLHLLYERDLRHQFCPSSLWLAPARKDGALASFTAKPILTTIPHVYAFEERVKIFRELIKQDKITNQVISGGPGPGTIEIVVRRDQIVEDGYKQLNSLGSRLKSSIHVSFVSSCGLPEPGLDYGGLSKEFLTDLSKSALNPEYGLFEQSCESEVNLMPSLSARILPNGLEMIEFIGRVVGKALYEGILLDISFSLIFIQKLLGRYSFLDELSSLDSQLYRNLMHLKYYDGDVRELCLDFTLTEELCGRMIVHELRPGGKNVQVNNENKLQYVHSMADFKLNRQIVPFANAFYRGLSDLISPSWLSLFNANEFNQLLSGGNQDFDVDDLKDNTKYTGGYSESSRTVKLFWEVIKGFNAKERSMLLKFVTSCSRAPLLGFKYLHPSFTIHKVACDVPIWATLGGQDVDRLPSASTCYNTLKLPTYKRSSTLRSKLLYSISSNAGFELS